MRSKSRAGLFTLMALVLILACGTAAASGELYQARTIVTGQGEESRKIGFATALPDVLVKVSGDPRLADEPAVAALAGRAASLVASYRYRDRMEGIPVHDEQGTRDRPFDLTVSFDQAEIDAALRSLGREPWTGSRPRIVMFVSVRPGGDAYLLAADGERGRDLREALAAAAERFGMTLALPSRAALSEARLGVETLPAADLATLDATIESAGGDVAMAGSLVWSDEALGWVAEWRLYSLGESYRWQISGVSFDAALRSAAAGAAQILSGHGPPK